MNTAWIALALLGLYAAAWVCSRFVRSPSRVVRSAVRGCGLDADTRIAGVETAGKVLTIQFDTGTPADEWDEPGKKLADALDRNPPTITSTDRGVTLRFLPKGRGEIGALTQWSAKTPTVAPDLRAVPIARTVYGDMWPMPVLGAHTLVIGATGSGKGSVIWSMAQQLAPAVQEGTVQLWGVDPKGGVELGYGEGMFTRFAYSASDAWEQELAELLADARAALTERLNHMRGNSRLHIPTPAQPLIVLIVDEFLALTVGVADKALRDQIDRDLVMILSQGRAAAVSVWACAQLAQKSVLSDKIRDLFPTRVGLRMTDPVQVDMAMGADARRAGAACHKIPAEGREGAAYVMGERGAPVAVRFPWTSDAAIRELARSHRPPVAPQPPRAVEAPPAADVELAEDDPPSKTERVLALLVEHPDWTQKAIAEAAGVTDRYVRMARDNAGLRAG